MKVKPLQDRILVKKLGAKDTSPGEIIIPEVAKEVTREAEVLAVGDGLRDDATGHRTPIDVKVGDRVLVGQYSGMYFEIEGQSLCIIRETEVFGVVT